MAYRTRLPINWVLKLRVYGKKIQNITIKLRYIIWSNNGDELSYKGFELTMTILKKFISHKVEIIQS
jgi:transposase